MIARAAAAAALVALAAPAAIAAAVRIDPVISWDNPGHNPFRGSKWHAVMGYDHIPLTTRVILALRIQHDRPDAIADIMASGEIRSASIDFTAAGLNDMHFGQRRLARRVTMHGWPAGHVEPAAVWCHEQWCIVEPFVCRNISWTTREWAPWRSPIHGTARTVSEPASGILAAISLLAVAVFRRRTPRA